MRFHHTKLVVFQLFVLLFLNITLCFSQSPKPLFSRLTVEQTGIAFRNQLIESADLNIITYEYFYNGGGVAIGDINNDGLADIYFSGNMVPNKLYLNKGNMVFEDITQKAGLEAEKGWKTGVSMVDINADGWLDIYLCRSGDNDEKLRTNKLFINKGNLSFSEEAEKYGLALPDYSTQAAFLDYDRDGDLDMFLLDHNINEVRRFDMSAQKEVYAPLVGDRLMRNDNGKFVDVTREAGILANPLSYGLGVAVSDVNNDGFPDIYVSNDYLEQDYLYMNNGDGTFSNKLEQSMGHISNFSMGSDIADINNDGLTDIFTVDMLPENNYRQKLLFAPDNYSNYQAMLDNGFYHQLMRNMLQLNNGDGTFSEIGQLAGISNTDWSWSALFADFDNSGTKDLFVSNGYGRDVINREFMKFYMGERFNSLRGVENADLLKVLQKIPPTAFTNYMYSNNGDLTFTNKIKEWGFDHKTLSNGAAYADLDKDGDLDLVVNNINGYAGVYENHTDQLKGHYLQIQLNSNTKNPNGIGAKVMLYSDGTVQKQEFYPSRGFQSAMHVPLHFGIGNGSIDSLRVIWPDGKTEILRNVKPSQLITLYHKNASQHFSPEKYPPSYLVNVDESINIPFEHKEDAFNDFKIQPLLPNMFSYAGPHLTKGDFNQDGLEDIYIGGAKGQPGQLMLLNQNGEFTLSEQNALKEDAGSEDTDALFFDADGDGDLDLYVCSGGYAYSPDAAALQDRLYFNVLNGVLAKRASALPKMLSSTSCISAEDYDKDGDVDLFAGGRVIPGKYPLTPQSYLLQNDGKGHFSIPNDSLTQGLQKVGMVTDAEWLDLNEDTWPDLVVVGEWMPIKVFINQNGRLSDQSSQYVSKTSEGWWQCIMAEDMDGDGDKDLVIGNSGLNSQIKVSADEPATLHFADFDQNGSIDPILSYYIMGKSYPSASRDAITNQMVSLRKKFPNYLGYANATINDVLSSEQLQSSELLKATRMGTSYLENTGEGLVFKPLPIQANFSQVCAILASDVNNDGFKDLLLAGNSTHVRLKFGKSDANYGALLLSKGDGSFSYVSQTLSGLCLKGDVRDIARIEINDKIYFVFVRNNDTPIIYTLNRNQK